MHREKYVMARFLATIAESERIQYPLELEHGDRPDFALQLGARSVGIECVEAVPAEWYEIEAIRERRFPDSLNWGQRFKPGEQTLTLDEKIAVASGGGRATPWAGDMAERQWAEAIEFFVQNKTEKLRAGNYARFSEVWLLIQDEWRVPMHYAEEVKLAADLCLGRLSSSFVKPCFSAIFVCTRGWLLTFQDGSVLMEDIRDLWREG